MKPKLLSPVKGVIDPQTNQRVSSLVFLRAKWSGKNQSGIKPIGDRVIVLPDVAAERTSGGIELTQEHAERESMAATSGMLVAMGEGAFQWNFDRVTPFVGAKPTPGTRVVFEKYCGQIKRGRDGHVYRVMDDRAIGGIEEDVEVTTSEDKAND